jgi:ubiquinone/menaquinone biosynthesis C-methylase UbiE
MPERMDNRSYYDAMAEGYERERHLGYHRFLDESEVAAVADLVRGREVLEVGCGTGLILARLQTIASRVAGVDLSPGMLEKARARGLPVTEGDATRLPFPDASFDAAVCFKVLAHIQDPAAAIREMCRVVRPGGVVAYEVYNRRSLRSLIKALKPADPIAPKVTDRDVFTRYDTIAEATGWLPPGSRVEQVRGIRIAVPWAAWMKVPGIAGILAASDRVLGASPLAAVAGFVVIVARTPDAV